MGGAMSQIVPGLYVGGLSSSKTESQLTENGITHICTILHYPLSLNCKRAHKQFIAHDSPDEDISKFFTDAADFIHEGRLNGAVLVHCACGVSRSVTLTLAYLLSITDFSLRDLYKAIQTARPGAAPNLGFLNQLVDFETRSGHKEVCHLLTQRHGVWPSERRSADRQRLEECLAAQAHLAETGVYPWERSPTGDSTTSTSFVHHLNTTVRTIDALMTGPPHTPPTSEPEEASPSKSHS